MNEAYCENGECRVIMYQVADTSHEAPGLLPDNCPGCGRFGRIKDEKESK